MIRRLTTHVCAVLSSVLWLTSGASAQVTVVMEDDFESYDKNAALIGGDWEEQKFYWDDTGCSEYAGEYPAWSSGGPVAAQNVNYFTQSAQGGPYSEYTKQGLSDNTNNVADALGLEVRQDAYGAANDACTTHRVFKRFTTTSLASEDIVLESGDYKIEGRAMISEYAADNSASAAVGVFLTIQLADAPYTTLVNQYRDLTVSKSSVTDIAEDFEVDLGSNTNLNVTVGMFSRTPQNTVASAIFDNFSLSFGGLTEEEKAALAAETAACENTSTIRFEEEFGDVDATCLTDTYSFPADAEDWGGYADKIKDESLYPFGHFYGGGTITLDCEKVGTGSQRVKFKFEVEGFPGNTNGPETDWATCTAPATSGLGRLSEVVATQDAGSITLQIPASPRGESYNNLIMYLETKGGADVKVTNVAITAARRSDPNSGAATGQPSPGMPIPVLPFWALLALVTATGLIAVRKR